MAQVFEILSLLSTLAWCGAFIWSTPAAVRVAVGRGVRRYDPLRALILFLATNRLGYGLRPLMFGHHTEAMSTVEIAFYQMLTLFSLACVYAVVIVVRGYERHR